MRTLSALFVVLLLLGALLLGRDASGDEATGAPTVGAASPTLRLNDQGGRPVAPIAVQRKAGRWTILAFFPKALTPG